MTKLLKYGCLSCLTLLVLAVFFVIWLWQTMLSLPQETREHEIRIAKEVFEDRFGLEVISVVPDDKIWSEAGHFTVTVTLKDGTLLDLDDAQEGPPYTLTYSTTGSDTVDGLLTDLLLNRSLNRDFQVAVYPFEDIKQLLLKPEVHDMVDREKSLDWHVYMDLAVDVAQLDQAFYKEMTTIKSLMTYHSDHETIFDAYTIKPEHQLEVRNRVNRLVDQGYFKLYLNFALPDLPADGKIEDYLNMDALASLPRQTRIGLYDEIHANATVKLEYQTSDFPETD